MSTGSQLAKISLLQGLPEAVLTDLARVARWHRFEEGEIIFDRQSDCRGVYLVIEGEVDVVNFSSQGREIAYARVKTGDFFGELSAIDGQPRSANIVAQSDCRIAELSRETFYELLRQQNQVSFRVLEKMVHIIRTADERIMDLATLGAHQRVCIELLRLAKPDPVKPGCWMIYPLPTQAEIAALASTTRETVARVMGQLAEDGLIRKVHKTVYIDSRDNLAELAQKLNPRREDGPAR
ncbi:Crp/Fnr family transcriptional regulator [Zavarzinia compransoris]|uniref:Crp/Fnr family transcriptional regulator n=1 Tax=Zavarzinia compransoris TaxID=1264899 RepID=A0A317E467_9PROT|nr:Crp/Fnr family transcriptional regulator [Zavarzinia compransoris]PWR19845.1 Crp/Fnr family transcriptional regulator [Zavarzinia compransoris]TDP45046.1 CRP-like cAMP-binding protein [Zavarzinia compransoris]